MRVNPNTLIDGSLIPLLIFGPHRPVQALSESAMNSELTEPLRYIDCDIRWFIERFLVVIASNCRHEKILAFNYLKFSYLYF
jgi:hypothetical protein